MKKKVSREFDFIKLVGFYLEVPNSTRIKNIDILILQITKTLANFKVNTQQQIKLGFSSNGK